MDKIKRNDPCPCGSGKKYKKCCMGSEAAQGQIEEQLYTQELYTIQAQLVEYAMSEHDYKMVTLANELFIRYNIPKELEETYMHGIFPWAIFHQSVNQWNKTIVKEYIQRYASTFSTDTVREAVQDWRDAYMSVYLVEETTGNTAVVKEYSASQPFSILLPDGADLTRGEIVAGIMLPVKGGAMPFIELLKISNEAMKTIITKLEQDQQTIRTLMHTAFPEVLSDIVKLKSGSKENEKTELQWEREEDQEVASLFTKLSDEISTDQRDEILSFWMRYSETESPSIRKPAIFAAALEYLAAKQYGISVSQSALAKKYETSASSISSKYKAMAKEFELVPQ
ncbi:YecA family protein [Alkalihalobacillus sp. CinArs1]|uniref:YecA family protein n=1 Tax=Alkalihalobacillus sp. CinArs1 TaxID=2995314 RepID=UPI0022DE3622|nr:SEC-C domain-containing protein [Alkalihalobacillus sp. CinArs1]